MIRRTIYSVYPIYDSVNKKKEGKGKGKGKGKNYTNALATSNRARNVFALNASLKYSNSRP